MYSSDETLLGVQQGYQPDLKLVMTNLPTLGGLGTWRGGRLIDSGTEQLPTSLLIAKLLAKLHAAWSALHALSLPHLSGHVSHGQQMIVYTAFVKTANIFYEGTVGTRFMLMRSAEAFAMMCPTLLLRPSKKAACLRRDPALDSSRQELQRSW